MVYLCNIICLQVVRNRKQDKCDLMKVRKKQSLNDSLVASESDNNIAHTHDNSGENIREFVVDESNIDLILNSIVTPLDDTYIVVVEPEHHDNDCEELQKILNALDITTENQEHSDHGDKPAENSIVDKSVLVQTDDFVVTLSSHI